MHYTHPRFLDDVAVESGYNGSEITSLMETHITRLSRWEFGIVSMRGKWSWRIALRLEGQVAMAFALLVC